MVNRISSNSIIKHSFMCSKKKRPQTADESKKCKTLDVFVGKSKPAGQSIVSLSCRLLRLEIHLEKRVAFLTADAPVGFVLSKLCFDPTSRSVLNRADLMRPTMRQVATGCWQLLLEEMIRHRKSNLVP